MQFQISFKIGTFDNSAHAFSFISKFINSKLTAIFSYKSYSDDDWIDSYEDVIKALSLNNDNGFTAHDGSRIQAVMYGDKVNSFTFLRESNYEIERIIVDYISESFINLDNLLKEAALLKFNTAQIFDFYKSMWQSERFPNNFRALNKSYDNKNLISHPMWANRGLIINLRENPGRNILTYNMNLMAAPEMWFGPGCWAYFEIENILNCKQVLKVKEILPAVVYVKLFEPEVEDYETPQILAIQKSFRDCSKMDEVEELLNTKLPYPPGY